jgi:hypothetical protein
MAYSKHFTRRQNFGWEIDDTKTPPTSASLQDTGRGAAVLETDAGNAHTIYSAERPQ